MSATAATVGSTRPLLIVDDDEDAHVFLKRDLAQCGIKHPVESVYGGEEAIAYLSRCLAGEKSFPALVFLDVKMPGLNGIDVLTWAHENQVLGKITLSMLSSSDDPKDVKAAMRLGAHTYLTKPPNRALLVELVSSAVRMAEREQPPAAPAPAPSADALVLVVDDSNFARRTTRKLVETLGHRVIEACSGTEAIQACTHSTPDVVLLDLVMAGGMDGFETLAALKASHPNPRVIVISADIQTESREQALRGGAIDFLNKPVSAQSLNAALMKALENSAS